VIALAIAFLLGSVPFGLLLTRAAGLGDIRAIGSGNIGATNVLRTGRKDLAAATLLLDVLKGTAAVLLARRLGGPAGWAGLAAVLGHTLTPWLGFRGGKGVATALGALLGIAWPVGLAAAAVWLAAAAALRVSSLAAMTACLVTPLVALVVTPYPWAVPVIAGWIILRHRANIARLRTGTEPRIGAR
jgi:glycerol-3-phosphate acyltransferase PlsY